MLKKLILGVVVIMLMLITLGYYKTYNYTAVKADNIAQDTENSVLLDYSIMKNQIIELTNEERKAHGLPILIDLMN